MTKSGCEVLRCQKFIGGVCIEKGEYKDSETGEPCCSHRRNAVHVSPAPDPRDALIEQMGEALKAMVGKAQKQNWNDNYPEQLEVAQLARAAWEKYKEAQG